MLRNPVFQLWLLVGFVACSGCGGSRSTYTSTAGNFHIDLASGRKEMDQDVPSPAGVLKMHFVTAGNSKSLSYAVMWADYPAGLVTPATINPMLDGVATGVVSGVKGKELSRVPIEHEGHPGREILLEAPAAPNFEKPVLRWRVYLVGDRLYQLHVASVPSKANPEIAKAFFESFALLNPVKPVTPANSTGISSVSSISITRTSESGTLSSSPNSTIPGWGAFYDPRHDCKADATPGELTISVPGVLHDFHLKPTASYDAPRVLQEVEGDFTVDVELPDEIRPSGQSVGYYLPYHGAGLIVVVDEQNYVRLEKAAVLRNNQVDTYVLFGGYDHGQDIGHDSSIVREPRYLRLERKNEILTAYGSLEPNAWRQLGATKVAWPAAAKVGIIAVNSTDQPFSARFRALKITKH